MPILRTPPSIYATGIYKINLEHFDSALRLANGDNMRKAMDMFMAVREDIEAMQVQSRNETESDSSDSDEDSNADDDDDDEEDENDGMVAEID